MWKIFKVCRTDAQKSKSFDTSYEGFFTDSTEAPVSVTENISKDLEDEFYVYLNMKKNNEKEPRELRSLILKEYTKKNKIFFFDFCILNGDAYFKTSTNYRSIINLQKCQQRYY